MKRPSIEYYKCSTGHKLLGATLFLRPSDAGLSVAVWNRRFLVTFGRNQ